MPRPISVQAWDAMARHYRGCYRLEWGRLGEMSYWHPSDPAVTGWSLCSRF